ncbi:hypothetical protein CFP66_12180 [Pseudonocardia sp. MH-G8]|nr:hypothetical protein CFP66_12180 [Pseudonocardia sp. MH-G8]
MAVADRECAVEVAGARTPRMLGIHPLVDGRCSGCLPLVHWPCTMANIARAAASRIRATGGER